MEPISNFVPPARVLQQLQSPDALNEQGLQQQKDESSVETESEGGKAPNSTLGSNGAAHSNGSRGPTAASASESVDEDVQQQLSFQAIIDAIPGTLREPGLTRCRRAYAENPAGFQAVAAEALECGKRPFSLLVYLVTRGCHRDEAWWKEHQRSRRNGRNGLSAADLYQLAEDLRAEGR